MATFNGIYQSEQSPEDLWRAINKPLFDPDLKSLVHEGVDVQYSRLSRQGQIECGSVVIYLPTDELIEKAPPVYRRFIPNDVEFFVHAMDKDGFGRRRDILTSGKAEGGIFRTVEDDDNGSILIVEATLSLNGLGSMFERQIEEALEATIGSSSAATVALVLEILES